MNTIFANYQLVMITDKETVKWQESADIDREGSWIWPEDTYNIQSFKSCTKAMIKLSIKITDLLDNNKEKVARTKWKQCGIIS